MQGTDVLGYALRFSLAAAFAVFGWEKLGGTDWVELFRELGAGDWLRYVTGGLQLLGAALLLATPTARAGAALIALTMVGAIGAHLFLLPTGIGGALIPLAFLGFAIAAGWRRPREQEAPVSLR